MDPWHIAMICVVPLILGRDKVRVWLTMAAASALSYLYWSPVWFMVIDCLAAAIVLSHPKGLAQRIIGGIFAGMALFDIGFFLSSQEGVALYRNSLIALGWAQWLVLLLWGLHDAWRYSYRRFGPVGGLRDSAMGRVR